MKLSLIVRALAFWTLGLVALAGVARTQVLEADGGTGTKRGWNAVEAAPPAPMAPADVLAG